MRKGKLFEEKIFLGVCFAHESFPWLNFQKETLYYRWWYQIYTSCLSTRVQVVQVSDNICNTHNTFTQIHNVQWLQMLLSSKIKELPAACSYETMNRNLSLLEKLIKSKLFEKFERIYAARSFVIVLAIVRHRTPAEPLDTVHTLISCLFQINFNNAMPSKSRSRTNFLPFSLPH